MTPRYAPLHVIDPVTIDTLDDPRVADYRNVRDADLRGGGGLAPRGESNRLFMAESDLVVRRLLESRRFRVKSLLLSPQRFDDLRTAMEATWTNSNATPPVYVASESLMRAIAGYRHHGGVLAAAWRPEPRDLAPPRVLEPLVGRDRCTLLLVEGVTNKDNVGAIFRNAAGFGADGVILDRGCADPLFRLSIRVSMGHVFHVPWAIAPDWPDLLVSLMTKWNVRLIAAETTAAARCVSELPRDGRVAIVVGAERHGVRADTIARCQGAYQIPLAAGVSSINVATAAAVFLYERSKADRSIASTG